MVLLSFGEIIWDVYNRDEQTLGGAPLNFAAYAALLGSTVWLASSVGTDKLGEKAVKQIKELGLKTEYISTSEKKRPVNAKYSLTKTGYRLTTFLKMSHMTASFCRKNYPRNLTLSHLERLRCARNITEKH